MRIRTGNDGFEVGAEIIGGEENERGSFGAAEEMAAAGEVIGGGGERERRCPSFVLQR